MRSLRWTTSQKKKKKKKKKKNVSCWHAEGIVSTFCVSLTRGLNYNKNSTDKLRQSGGNYGSFMKVSSVVKVFLKKEKGTSGK